MAKYTVNAKYFFGNKISDYGLKNGYVDYATLAKSFDAVLNNDIIKNTANIGEWEQVNGFTDDREYYPDIYQYYIISSAGATILEEFTDEIVFYNDSLDMFVWGVCHYGTAWDYVLTDIPVMVEE